MSNKTDKNLRNCFDENGYLKFDPYRTADEDKALYYDHVFTESGYLIDREAVVDLARRNPHWGPRCHAVGLYHADLLALNTKGSYSTIYYFR